MGVFSNNPDYWKGKATGTKNGDVEVLGVEVNVENLGRLMTTDPTLAKNFRKYIKDVLKVARKDLTKNARDFMDSDPRKAAQAVKYAVYKTMFGGNLSILQKGRGKAGAKYQLIRQRKVEQNPHMRGGNRRPRIDDGRNRLDYYYSSDRSYILRFIGSGTVPRMSRFGNRGSIRRTDWFGRTAPWQMDVAAEKVAEALNEYIKHVSNG